MVNTSKQKTPMPEAPASERIKGFSEVALGYTAEMAQNEASRCLNCKDRPCAQGCPVAVRIPEFLALAAKGEFTAAYKKLRETNSLPAICGRVCPQETQCEKFCVRGKNGEPVAIGRIERFCADYAIEHGCSIDEKVEKNGIKTAVVGSGPSGLACAADLARMGYDVTIFEAFHTAGGVLKYGIPEFRLPKALVDKEVDGLRAMGVDIETNVVIGKTLTAEDLFAEGYKAVFVGTGAGLPGFMHIPGENLCGVYSANEFLTRINLMKAYKFPETDTPIKRYKNVAVVGGGNVAMDAARCALRLGAEHVYLVYRRTEVEMPARAEEIEHARAEGIEFRTLTNPVAILGDENGWVSALRNIKNELGEPDASGRRRPVAIEGSEYEMPVDAVIIAIGQSPNPLIAKSTPGLETGRHGVIVANEHGATSVPGIFAGGDAVTGAATVILAMGAGRDAARAMDEYIKSHN